MPSLHINKITIDTFNKTLVRYSEMIPSTLADLDKFRYDSIPAKLVARNEDAHLLKADVEKLVEWKLKHGTFRPSLMKLVQSNSADVIKETTHRAFNPFRDDGDVIKALKTLTLLRGIGPATASLLLSVYSPDQVPFFSDELFRWTHWDAPGRETGWDRRIKYNVTEYKEVLASVEALRERLGVRAVDAERVAYVLGREMVDLDGGVDAETDGKDEVREDGEGKSRVEDTQEESRKRVQEALEELRQEKIEEDKDKNPKEQAETGAQKKGMKRKAAEEQPPTTGARRSTRKKA